MARKDLSHSGVLGILLDFPRESEKLKLANLEVQGAQLSSPTREVTTIHTALKVVSLTVNLAYRKTPSAGQTGKEKLPLLDGNAVTCSV